jgi:hypothetical protein
MEAVSQDRQQLRRGCTRLLEGRHLELSSGVEVPGYWKDGTWNGLTPLESLYADASLTIIDARYETART